MNRLRAAVDRRTVGLEGSRSVVTTGRYGIGHDDLPHSVWTPLHYESGYAYPLVIWLHGPGDDEHQLKRIMLHVDARNYVAVAPRGTARASGPSARGYDWSTDQGHLGQAEERVNACLADVAGRFNIHPDRIFLAGYDAGGTMAYRLALAAPRRFAGVLSLCGAFPRVRAPLAGLEEARRLPVFMATGQYSGPYAPEQVCDDLRLFHAAGICVTLRQYSCGQTLTPEMLADMNRWLMEQICGNGES